MNQADFVRLAQQNTWIPYEDDNDAKILGLQKWGNFMICLYS